MAPKQRLSDRGGPEGRGGCCRGHFFRLSQYPAVAIAVCTTCTIYADLAIAVVYAVEGHWHRFWLAAAFWMATGLYMVIRSRSAGLGADTKCACVPHWCRDICCRSSDADEEGRDGTCGRLLLLTLLTLVHLRLLREAMLYVSALHRAQAIDAGVLGPDDEAPRGPHKRWDDATQQHQINFLGWVRACALVVSCPQVVLQAYYQISLNEAEWFGLLSVGLSLLVMSFAFSSIGPDPFKVGGCSFARGIAFQFTYLAAHLGSFALFSGCHAEFVLLALAGGILTNMLILYLTNAHVIPLDCCKDIHSDDAPCELCVRLLIVTVEQLSAKARWPGLLLACTERLVFLNVARMYVWEWRPLYSPLFREDSAAANWYIYWKNSVFSAAMLAVVFVRHKRPHIDEAVCPRFYETIAPDNQSSHGVPLKLFVLCVLFFSNLVLFFLCLNDPHEPAAGPDESGVAIIPNSSDMEQSIFDPAGDNQDEMLYVRELDAGDVAHLSPVHSPSSPLTRVSAGSDELGNMQFRSSPGSTPGSPRSPRRDTLVLRRQPATMQHSLRELGLVFADPSLLVDVTPGTPSDVQGAPHFVGQRLVRVGSDAVGDADAACAAAAGLEHVELGFSDSALLILRKEQGEMIGRLGAGLELCEGDPVLQGVTPGSAAERQGALLFQGRRIKWAAAWDEGRMEWERLMPISSALELEELTQEAGAVRLVFDNPRLKAGDRVLVRAERRRWLRGTVRQVSKRHVGVQPDFFFCSLDSMHDADWKWNRVRRPSAVVERHPFLNTVRVVESDVPLRAAPSSGLAAPATAATQHPLTPRQHRRIYEERGALVARRQPAASASAAARRSQAPSKRPLANYKFPADDGPSSLHESCTGSRATSPAPPPTPEDLAFAATGLEPLQLPRDSSGSSAAPRVS